MMDHNSLLLEIARQRQQERLRQAEAERLYRQLKRNRPNLLQQIGHRMTDAVRQFITHIRPHPATPPLVISSTIKSKGETNNAKP
ncbi:MAG: hypothetical protein KDJ52_22290 [Anaerolineae bacterium]|nr:hypothetical protein [Anaerolineae bacterium]MCB0212089.1 hypothetical protein [Anaerolineae bacterium]